MNYKLGKVFLQFIFYSNQTSGCDLKNLSCAKLRKEAKKPSLLRMAFKYLNICKDYLVKSSSRYFGNGQISLSTTSSSLSML